MKTLSCHTSRTPTRRFLLKTAGAALIASSAGMLGCVGDLPDSIPGRGEQATGAAAGRSIFAELEGDLMAACGSCHDAGGYADTPFLRGPDRYRSIVSWPDFIVKDATKSRLMTYPVSGTAHAGVNLDGEGVAPTLLSGVRAWLEAEATALAESPNEETNAITPFVPILGHNAVYLGEFGDAFKAVSLMFTANELHANMLELSALGVHASSQSGVRVVHPLFTVHPVGGAPEPDPLDSFFHIDIEIKRGAAGSLPPGTLLLTNWSPDARLSVAFELIEEVSDEPGDEGPLGCKALPSFQSAAEPRFAEICATCHGGGNPVATAAVNMTKLMTDSAGACAQIRSRVRPEAPEQSQIFITTDPSGNAAHPYKFSGKKGSFEAFRAAVSTWIKDEK